MGASDGGGIFGAGGGGDTGCPLDREFGGLSLGKG